MGGKEEKIKRMGDGGCRVRLFFGLKKPNTDNYTSIVRHKINCFPGYCRLSLAI